MRRRHDNPHLSGMLLVRAQSDVLACHAKKAPIRVPLIKAFRNRHHCSYASKLYSCTLVYTCLPVYFCFLCCCSEPTQRPCSNSSQSRICPPLDAHSFSKFENLPSGHFLLVLLLNEEPVNGEHTLDESLLSAFLATTESYDRCVLHRPSLRH